MKQVFARFLTLFMAVAVLGSTVGITVFKHTCFAANHSKTSVFKIKSCCGEKAEKGPGPRCCETKLSYLRVQDEKRTSDRVMPLIPVLVAAIIPDYHTEAAQEHLAAFDPAFTFRPPPLSGAELSLRYQNFRS